MSNIETLHLAPGELVEHNREAHAFAALIVAHLSLTLLQWVWLPNDMHREEFHGSIAATDTGHHTEDCIEDGLPS